MCDEFERYAQARLATEPTWLDELKGKDLECWCAPRRCHAETLLRMANRTTNTDHCIKVAAGHYFNLAAPRACDVELKSIAAALSKICRFGGHCPKFYSVAEHCVHACELAKGDSVDTDTLRAILMHDAAEAYVGDMVKPLKEDTPQFGVAESRVEAAISERFGIDFEAAHSTVKKYDMQILAAEKAAIWPEDTEEWGCLVGVQKRQVEFWWATPEMAEARFLEAAHKLGVMYPQ